jgi:hypothetical protein
MTKEEVLKIGDTVKIINHKFPEFNPKIPINKTIRIGPEELTRVYREFKKPEDADLTFVKEISFKYQLKGVNCLGLVGEINGIRNAPETKYEIETGDVAKYVIRFTTDHPKWKNKKMTLFPSQIELVRESNPTTQMKMS